MVSTNSQSNLNLKSKENRFVILLQTVFQKPKFVIDGFERGDLDQGEIGQIDEFVFVFVFSSSFFRLGNCWFIAGAGAVTLNPDLVKRVIPQDQTFDENEYAG